MCFWHPYDGVIPVQATYNSSIRTQRFNLSPLPLGSLCTSNLPLPQPSYSTYGAVHHMVTPLAFVSMLAPLECATHNSADAAAGRWPQTTCGAQASADLKITAGHWLFSVHICQMADHFPKGSATMYLFP